MRSISDTSIVGWGRVHIVRFSNIDGMDKMTSAVDDEATKKSICQLGIILFNINSIDIHRLLVLSCKNWPRDIAFDCSKIWWNFLKIENEF